MPICLKSVAFTPFIQYWIYIVQPIRLSICPDRWTNSGQCGIPNYDLYTAIASPISVMSEQGSPELLQQILENASKLTEDQGNSISVSSSPTLKDLMTLLVQHTICGSIVQRDERVAEREAFTQQLSAVTDKFAFALASQKAKTDALESSVIERESLARAERREDKLEAKALMSMHAGEDIFSLLLRFESVLVAREVETFNWVTLLERVLRGKYLDVYYNNLDSYAGNWSLRKSHLLNASGYNIHDCLDLFLSRFRPGGTFSASQWASVRTHRFYVISKALPFLDSYQMMFIKLLHHRLPMQAFWLLCLGMANHCV